MDAINVNEEEYEEYLNQIDGMHEQDNAPLREQLRDEDGNQVPGCYRIIPSSSA